MQKQKYNNIQINKYNQEKDLKNRYNNVINKLHDYIYSSAIVTENIVKLQDLSLKTESYNKNILVDKQEKYIHKYQKNELNKMEEKVDIYDSSLNKNILSLPQVSQTYRETRNLHNKDVCCSYTRKTPSFFYPKEKDTLFWCFYIIKNGFSQYETPNTTSFVNEKKLKFEYIELLRKNKQVLKLNKVKNKETIEDELANKEKISEKTFIALCIVENLNVLLIHNKKCFEIKNSNIDADTPTAIVHITNSSKGLKYCYEINPSKKNIDNYREKYFKWENIDKHLASMSSYKLNELKEIYEKIKSLNLPLEKVDSDSDLGPDPKLSDGPTSLFPAEKKTKKDYYDYILSNI
jgi:hypothetical protein